jgi:hypothetical protein
MTILYKDMEPTIPQSGTPRVLPSNPSDSGPAALYRGMTPIPLSQNEEIDGVRRDLGEPAEGNSGTAPAVRG